MEGQAEYAGTAIVYKKGVSMNYMDFIEKVQKQIASMTPEEKDEWILKRAASYAEEEREDFLKSFSTEASFEMKMKEALACCRELEKMEAHFTCEWVEEYEDYWSDNSYWDYEDNWGTGKKLGQLFRFFA